MFATIILCFLFIAISLKGKIYIYKVKCFEFILIVDVQLLIDFCLHILSHIKYNSFRIFEVLSLNFDTFS